MSINIFEGSRRIALIAAVLATVGTVVALATSDPYVSVQYSVAHPQGPFSRMQGPCPIDATTHYFSASTAKGGHIGVTLCLLAMPFGNERKLLIPYKVDDKGMIWGAAPYSTEVSEYERQLQRRFTLPPADGESIDEDLSRKYWGDLREGFGYLIVGLAIFGAFVWAIGWIMRGFLGIPHGMDTKPQ